MVLNSYIPNSNILIRVDRYEQKPKEKIQG